MTVSFKTFSENIIEANATQNLSVFNDLSTIGKGAIVSVGADVASFGAVGWGRTNSKGSTSKGSTDNPMQTYFNNNSNSSKLQTKNTLALLRATPGLLPTKTGEDEGNGDESPIIFKLQMQDGDSEADGSNAYTGMTTDALYFGDPGDDEQMETIYKTALYRHQEAQQRWKKLKNWIKSIGVDPSIQSKIASPTAVLSINTPAIMKGHHYYKDLKDLKNKMKKGKG